MTTIFAKTEVDENGDSKIQSVLIDTHKFTLRKAYDWVVTHGFKHNKIDVKLDTIDLDRLTPNPNKQYRTINLTDGVKAIFEF